jgi:hypothetical protein
MVLKSESKAIKHVNSPARDRKYVLVAYSRMMAENADKIELETLQQLVSGLIELAAQSTSTGFISSTMIEKDSESLLMDGAVD